MKNLILILTLFFSIILTFGQNDSNTFFDEFSILLNKTDVKNYNTNDRIGLGIGVYLKFFDTHKVNILFGFEYNRTSQFKKNMCEGHFANSTDITYYINSISVPITMRINIGNRLKAFIESGTFLDLNAGARRKGVMHTCLPNDSNQVECKEFDFEENAGVSSINYGISFGIGIIIPISKIKLVIKPDYKFGVGALYDDYGDQIYNRYFRVILGIII